MRTTISCCINHILAYTGKCALHIVWSMPSEIVIKIIHIIYYAEQMA